MQVTLASEPTPGRPNEDCAVVGPNWAVVLDGATEPDGLDSGCIHGVSWLVRQLAGQLARTLLRHPAAPLVDVVADAIASTCAAHEPTCDLTNPDSPSSTVSVLRLRGAHIDYLALADSPILLDRNGDISVIVDDRTAQLGDYSYAGIRAARNCPGGFYVASTRPEVVEHAVHAAVPAEQVRAAALLTDGASRLADLFHLLTWPQLFEVLRRHGPNELIARTRTAERQRRLPGRRHKRNDDATAVFLDFRATNAERWDR